MHQNTSQLFQREVREVSTPLLMPAGAPLMSSSLARTSCWGAGRLCQLRRHAIAWSDTTETYAAAA